MSFIGYLYGSKVYTNKNCGIMKTYFTRKQTRKFKNNRWVKKYLKKYSYQKLIPQIISLPDKIIMHPIIYDQFIKLKGRIKFSKEDESNHLQWRFQANG